MGVGCVWFWVSVDLVSAGACIVGRVGVGLQIVGV